MLLYESCFVATDVDKSDPDHEGRTGGDGRKRNRLFFLLFHFNWANIGHLLLRRVGNTAKCKTDESHADKHDPNDTSHVGVGGFDVRKTVEEGHRVEAGVVDLETPVPSGKRAFLNVTARKECE